MAPGVIFESIAAWNAEAYDDKMKVEIAEKDGQPRSILLSCEPAADSVDYVETEEGVSSASADGLHVKIKFFKASNDQDGKTRVRFQRKKGDIIAWS